MRKTILSIVLMLSLTTAAMAQSSTEGKDFWVSSTIVCSPDDSPKLGNPYIAISAEKACYVTIDFADGTHFVQNTPVGAGSWNAFTFTTAQLAKWYPTTIVNANNVKDAAGQIHSYGLHVTSTENVSVYVILSASYSMDASNILPMTALQQEYYTQDYWPDANGFDNAVAMTTVLATENNTVVDITPSAATYDNHAAGVTYQVTLQQGETYYLMTQVGKQLSGTHIVAEGGKKIAVFNGTPLTRLPSGVAARDCLFEQAMPVDYWGTQFVATRSLGKDGNIIGVTAMEDGTTVQVDGTSVKTLNSGETWYLLLESANDPYANKPGTHAFAQNEIYKKDAICIETSCPVAVYSYDTGNSFKSKTGSEIVNGTGDPSSVWISPLQQKISQITFGACYTQKTTKHFINVIAETAHCQQTKLLGFASGRSADMSHLLTWTPVAGTNYSYARTVISDSIPSLAVFKLQNQYGLIAHVYGNGEDESYAYSVGSSAAKRGVSVDGMTFVDGSRSSEPFCRNSDMLFDAQVGQDVIDRVDWDFGDGVTESNGAIQTNHTYDSPGWYDVSAKIYAHKVCPETTYPAETVSFSFRVTEPDTLYRRFYICAGETLAYGGKTYAEATQDTARFDCDSVVVFQLEVGQPSAYEFDTVAKDQLVFGGKTIYQSGTYTDTLVNAAGCDSVVTVHARVVACLQLTIGDVETPICGDQGSFFIPYTHTRGDIGDAYWISGNQRVLLEPVDQGWDVPLETIKPGKYPLAYIEVADTNCGDPLRFNLPTEVLYPSSVFEQKWEDVLAVLNTKYNGGYDVVAYQWYRNGQPVAGATSSVYYVGPDAVLQPGDEYAVMLTTKDGMSLLSCPKVIPGSSNTAAQPTKTAILLAPGVLMLEVGDQQVIVR